MKRDLTVYIASAWWRDSDPYVTVCALTAEACEKAIMSAIEDAAREAFDSDCEPEDGEDAKTVEDYEDDQAWSGVFPESLRETLGGMFGKADDLKADLRASGVAYLTV